MICRLALCKVYTNPSFLSWVLLSEDEIYLESGVSLKLERLHASDELPLSSSQRAVRQRLVLLVQKYRFLYRKLPQLQVNRVASHFRFWRHDQQEK